LLRTFPKITIDARISFCAQGALREVRLRDRQSSLAAMLNPMAEDHHSLYHWLDEAILAVKTPKYFELGPPSECGDLSEFEAKNGALPEEYRGFLLNYGPTKLFRERQHGWHELQVYRLPDIAYEEETHTFAEIARVGDTFAYFVIERGAGRFDDIVLEHSSTGGIRTTGRTFSSWLMWRFKRERKGIKKAEWDEILRGPAPFTAEEEQIVRARSQFRVRKVGSDEKNNVILEVHNGSERTLQYLTVFLKGASPNDFGGRSPVYVGNIPPGVTKTLPVAFYKDFVYADSVVVRQGYPPGPEDRYIFYELTGPKWFRNAIAAGRKLASQKTDLPPAPDAPTNLNEKGKKGAGATDPTLS
jgi:hypothetical protein